MIHNDPLGSDLGSDPPRSRINKTDVFYGDDGEKIEARCRHDLMLLFSRSIYIYRSRKVIRATSQSWL